MSLINTGSLALVPYIGQGRKPALSQRSRQENLREITQNVAKSSFSAQFRDYEHFHHYWKGDIVILAGTSTAGKTSIIQALKKLEPDRIEDGGDLRYCAMDLKNLNKFNPGEVEILKKALKGPLDIPKAVFSPERSWKPGASAQDKMEAEDAIRRIKATDESLPPEEREKLNSTYQNIEEEMFDDAFEYSRRGGNIIFDVLNIDALSRHVLLRNYTGPMRVALVYCPFHILSERMEKRNTEAVENGELSNQRIGTFPLMQFSEIYSLKGRGQEPLERLTREQVTKVFDENFDKGIEAVRLNGGRVPSKEQIAMDKEISRAEFLGNLGFSKGVDVVEVAPKNQSFYNIFINSGEMLPEQSAKIIHEGTYQRYSRLC